MKIAAAILSLILGLASIAKGESGDMSRVLGFGAASRGGLGGKVLRVTRLDDEPAHPAPGSFRWALKQRGPRIVKFAVAGDILLKDRIVVREPYLTIDGSDAPGEGVCIRHGSLMFRDIHDVVVRQVRIRLGAEAAKRQRREQKMDRPQHSAGLDCVSMDDSERIVFDHCSLSWSCDEIFGITHSSFVTIQWCILSEPLAGKKLHPYGNDHACPINASAGKITVHHCLMEHFVFRGPQFECNDMRPEDHFTVQMEAVNNVIADYERSGSRYSLGVEKDNGEAEGKSFQFQFINNLYLSQSRDALPIEAISRHGVTQNVRLYAAGNLLGISTRIRAPAFGMSPFGGSKGATGYTTLATRRREFQEEVHPPYWSAGEEGLHLERKVSARRLFATSASAATEPAESALEQVLTDAGCTPHRDAVDRRAIKDVRERNEGKVLRP